MKKIRSFTSGMTFRLVCGTMALLLLVVAVTSAIGYQSFTEHFSHEYIESACHTAKTALMVVDGDKLEEYLAANGADEDYQNRSALMEQICIAQHVTMIYVFSVDRSDYGRFVVVFNVVHPDNVGDEDAPDGSKYDPWRIGDRKDTTNDEYRAIYRDLYEGRAERGYVLRTSGLRGHEPHVTMLIPVKDSAGGTVGVLGVQRPMSELAEGRYSYLRSIALSILGITALAVLALTGFLRRSFADPTRRIMEEAVRFSKENSLGGPAAFKRGGPGEVRELRQLSDALRKMEEDTLRYMDDLTSVTAEQERLATELSLATRIQANMLPNLFPPFPERKEFDIYASMTPAREVGGDFYDFFLLDDDHLALVMADVSGKGIPAALFMMATKNLIKSHAMMGGTPAEVLERVNRETCRNNSDDMFVTVWFGILTISTGEVTAANAGHEYPVIGRGDGGFELFKDRHGFVIGGIDGARYRDYTFTLRTGDALFLYTDGVPEAADAQNEMFGTGRMLEALNRVPGVSVHEALSNVNDAVHAFVGDAEQFDDLTMLCLKLTSRDTEKDIVLAPDEGSTAQVSEFLERTAGEWEVPPKAVTALQIALDEVWSNIVRYSGASTAVCKLQKNADCVEMIFVDDGAPYDPTEAPEPDVTLSAEERKIGGLGIFMVRKLMDEVVYKHENGKNILILKKRTG